MRKKNIKFVKDLQKNQPEPVATWELEDLFVIYVDLSDSGTSLSFDRFPRQNPFQRNIYVISIFI